MISYEQWKKLNETLMPMTLGLKNTQILGIRGAQLSEDGCSMETEEEHDKMHASEMSDEDDMESDEDDMESDEEDMESDEDDMESDEEDMKNNKNGFEESIVGMMAMEQTYRKIN